MYDDIREKIETIKSAVKNDKPEKALEAGLELLGDFLSDVRVIARSLKKQANG